MMVDLSPTNMSAEDYEEPVFSLVGKLLLMLPFFFHPHVDVKLSNRVKKCRLDLFRSNKWEVLVQETLLLLHQQPAPRFVQKIQLSWL